MSESSVISLAFPIDSRLHAHANGNWRSKATPTKEMREYAYLVAKSSGHSPIHGHVLVSYRFSVPDRKRRDRANLLQACKPIIDGICDAGLVDGDHWEVMSIGGVSVKLTNRKSVSVVIEIEPAEQKV